MPSTLETVDSAIYDWINKELNIFATTNEGWKKTPLLWASAERSYQTKRGPELRDSDGTLILPLITIERTKVVKDLAKKGPLGVTIFPTSDAKGGTMQIARRIQQDKTSEFNNLDSSRKHGSISDPQVGSGQENSRYRDKASKTVYEILSVPYPVYLDISYNIKLRSEYQQQMNEMVSPFIAKTGGINSFFLRKDGHKYETFIQSDFGQDNNVSNLNEDERKYITNIEIKVLGYIIGEGKNQTQPKVVIRETAAKFRFQRERVVLGDMQEFENSSGFYKE